MGLLDAIEERFVEQFDIDSLLFHAKIELPAAITQKNMSKPRNHSDTARGRVSREEVVRRSKEMESIKETMVLALQERAKQLHYRVPIESPMWIMQHFFYPSSIYYSESGLVSKSTPNLIKLIEFTEKCLVKSNTIWSAKTIHSHDGSRKLAGESNAIEIFIMKYNMEKNRSRFRASGDP